MLLVSTIISTILAIYLGVFVLLKNRKSYTNIIFAFFSFFISLSLVVSYFSLVFLEKNIVLFFMRCVMALAVTQCISFFVFILTLATKETVIKKSQKFLLFFVGIVTISICFSKYLFSEVIINSVDRRPVVSWGMILFITVVLGLLLLGFINLIKCLKNETGLVKIQCKYIFVGSCIMYSLILIFNVVFVLLKKPNFVCLLPFFILPFLLLTAYAITRYRFMDIKVVVRKSLLYFLLFALTIVFSLGAIILLYFFMKNYLQIESNIALLISVALLIIFLPILQKNLKKFFNQYFNKELIDLSAKVEEFATSINQTHQLNDVIMRCDSFVKNKLQIKDTKFIVRDIRVSELQYICQSPTNSTIIGIAGLKDNIKYFLEHGLVILEEIKFMENSKMAINNNIRPLRKILEKNHAQILVPLISNDIIHGFILLGHKESHAPYSQEDIEFIKNISQEISPALEKVLFYEEAVERVRREFGGEK